MRDERKKFDETVAILVKAYLEGTLEHANCYACAVGNIVASHWQIPFIKSEIGNDWPAGNDAHWYELVGCGGSVKGIKNDSMRIMALHQIAPTGYSAEELIRIEYSFERAHNPGEWNDFTNDEWMFNGLMAVVDVLAEIHGIDLTTKEESKKLFVKVTG
jgi:hypothetical protein